MKPVEAIFGEQRQVIWPDRPPEEYVGFSEDTQPCPRVWFSPWFLRVCYCDSPKVEYHLDDGYVRAKHKVKNEIRIWKLTDEYDKHGRRLGVWPD